MRTICPRRIPKERARAGNGTGTRQRWLEAERHRLYKICTHRARVGDIAEDIAVFGLFGDAPPRGSTKGHTGHTLGAAGIVEAIISVLTIEEGFLPGNPHTETIDPTFRGRYQLVSERARSTAC